MKIIGVAMGQQGFPQREAT